MKKRRRSAGQDEVTATWLQSYGDMITLILCFFVLLFSMSSIDAKKWQAVSESLQEALGGAPERGSGIQEGDLPALEQKLQIEEAAELDLEELQELMELKKKIDAYVKDKGLENMIVTDIEDVGLVVRITTDEVVFDLGSAVLKPLALAFLDHLAPLLKETRHEIWVEGHTDDIPIQPGFVYPSNWELSTARASAVIRYFIERWGFDPARLSAAGYADTKPRFPNDSPEHRALNRRVEMVIRPSRKEKAVESAGVDVWEKVETALEQAASEPGVSVPEGDSGEGNSAEGN
ncbi:MAG: flagellar motor protein MotB [Actinomycetota bacterium]|nr:flagellar motor protein MotB [Actinomycetota bacterium]MDI7252094.1 flagellar motor protein MotB [Actinomycetota bacterium]